MKYKTGDKVVLKKDKSWGGGKVRRAMKKLPNRVATIAKAKRDSLDFGWDYFMKEIKWGWDESEIEGLVLGLEPELIIISRFELMEL